MSEQNSQSNKRKMSCLPFSRLSRKRSRTQTPDSGPDNYDSNLETNSETSELEHDSTLSYDTTSEPSNIVEKKNTDDVVCSICYDEDAQEKPIETSCCKQIIHEKCLRKHFKPECPFCRKELKEKNGEIFKIEGSLPEPDFPFPIGFPFPLLGFFSREDGTVIAIPLLPILVRHALDNGVLGDVVENFPLPQNQIESGNEDTSSS